MQTIYTSTLLARLVEGCWTLSQVSIGDLSEGPGLKTRRLRAITPSVKV